MAWYGWWIWYMIRTMSLRMAIKYCSISVLFNIFPQTNFKISRDSGTFFDDKHTKGATIQHLWHHSSTLFIWQLSFSPDLYICLSPKRDQVVLWACASQSLIVLITVTVYRRFAVRPVMNHNNEYNQGLWCHSIVCRQTLKFCDVTVLYGDKL